MEFMVKAKRVMAFMAMVALIGTADIAAQSTNCDSLMPTVVLCFNFLAGNDQCPSPECCKALTNVVHKSPVCYCPLLNGTGGDQLNVTRAPDLLMECMVPFPGICGDYDTNLSLDEAPAVPSCGALPPLPSVPAAPAEAPAVPPSIAFPGNPFVPITTTLAPSPFFRRLLGTFVKRRGGH
ncbi:non-specific lipid transfer protein GPI-anchored 29-like [Cryptomeria japonica]|uniref:non-specific lipid transfer protein GPI-anchored 29-like n=1 Tax=Cryptomeria japonica TaxID=3369 RepID=UPI0025AD22A2|nr:non-specific lipid transfer protein GPI-anchored 29-like [Cryptomeria japonica]